MLPEKKEKKTHRAGDHKYFRHAHRSSSRSRVIIPFMIAHDIALSYVTLYWKVFKKNIKVKHSNINLVQFI